mgnify:CR=1 FL=1
MTETQIKPTEEEITVSDGIYAKYIKRVMDFFLSFCAIVMLSPIMIFNCCGCDCNERQSIFYAVKTR